jgi:hypothetical protein
MSAIARGRDDGGHPKRRMFRSTRHDSSRSAQAEVSTSDSNHSIDPGDTITEITGLDEHEDRDEDEVVMLSELFAGPWGGVPEPLADAAERYDNPHNYDRRGRLLDAGRFSGMLGCFRDYLGRIRAAQWALASSGWITLACVELLPSGSPPRVLLVFVFILLCPGLAVARLVLRRESAELLVVAVPLSMSLGLLVSVALTVLRVDSVMLGVGSLALITTIAALAEALWRRRARFSFALPVKGPKP